MWYVEYSALALGPSACIRYPTKPVGYEYPSTPENGKAGRGDIHTNAIVRYPPPHVTRPSLSARSGRPVSLRPHPGRGPRY